MHHILYSTFVFLLYSTLSADRSQGHKTVELIDWRKRARENRRPRRLQRVRWKWWLVEFKCGHPGVYGSWSAGSVDENVQWSSAWRVGTGLHVVCIRLRSVAVHRWYGAGGARADSYATGAVAGRTRNVSTAGAPVAPSSGQGPRY